MKKKYELTTTLNDCFTGSKIATRSDIIVVNFINAKVYSAVAES